MLKKPRHGKKTALIAAVFVMAFVSVIAFWLVSKPRQQFNPEFSKYIEAYTSGVISKKSAIRIQFASNVSTLHAQDEIKDNLFKFSPSVNGKTYWIDARTIEFRPDEELKPEEEYNVKFDLKKLVDVPPDFQIFNFSFQVIKPSLKFSQDGLKAYSGSSSGRMKLTGSVSLADVEDPEKIEHMVKAQFGGKAMLVKWTHDSLSRTSKYTIDSIIRGKTEAELTLKWGGNPINSNLNGTKILQVPALGSAFKVLDIKAMQDEEQFVLVQFSDPVLVAQDLNGLIGISTVSNVRYTIDGSEVKVYAPDRLEGNYTVAVNQGIESINSMKLTTGMSANVNFENQLPSVNIPGKGVILPDSGQITFPFEAVNLNAVDVTIVKIYENNIPQFLQQNTMDGGRELRRVASPMVERTIRLDNDKGLNLHKKNRFSLDIDKLLRAEPGAIYRITIGFRKSYSIYNCSLPQTLPAGENKDEYYGDDEGYYEDSNAIDEDDDFWSRYSNYYPAGYNWNEKDDPCTESYYMHNRWATRNIISSNIGLIAKSGSNNNLVIAATDILTTQPLAGVELKLLDYQQQVLQTITTGSDGLASASLKHKPYLLVAAKGLQKGYLKLDDASSLPLSRFNVAGDIVQKGVKGFIYGERGVWRPGDSLFISFVLEDKDKKLPPDLPVAFELYNPSGQLTKQLIQNRSLNGFYVFRTATDGTAPTGNWMAKIKVGGAVFQKSLKIETIMPNRLKINIDFSGKKALVRGSATKGILSAKWLFGAVAQSLKAKVDVTLVPGNTTFTGFPGYTFDDPVNTFQPENKTIFEGRLDANGNALINTNVSPSSGAPGILQANFATKVFEPGGNFSTDNFSLPYHVYNAYAGIRLPEGDKLSGMLFTDKDNTVSMVSVNAAGALIAGERKVQIELYKIQWRWWWDQEEQNPGNFTQDKYNYLLKKETLTLTNGSGKWNLRINSPDWGRYLIRVKDLQSGHTTGKTVYIDWPGWAQREQQNNPTDAAMLSFTADKEKYAVGQEVTLTIPSSKGGRGLVSIETGSKVLKTWWIETTQGQTNFKFKVEKEMAPNVYVNVTLLQPHAQTLNDLPIRMYGVIPLLVEDRETILNPVITMPATLRPETKNNLTVSEKSGKAITYTIAIVDEGLLDLTRFKTPDPHTAFYAREALGVKTWDLFDNIIGAWGSGMERILSIGGDAGINRNIKPSRSNRFKPVVKFMGPYRLAKGEKKNHAFTLPPYIGSVRTMVIAGEEGAYGFTEKTAEVKKPLMLLATLPRVAGPLESFKLPVTVFAMDNNIKKVNLQIQTNNLLISKNNIHNVSFDSPGEKMVYADIVVKDVTGLARVTITATSGSEKVVYQVELDIRNPNPYITSVRSAEIQAGKNMALTAMPIGSAATNSAMLEISSIPPVNLTRRLNYLIQYPHGCVEQITSSVFPQLILNQLTDLSEQQKTAIERNIKAGINRLNGFRTSDGGLSYWPGNTDTDEWGTNYAGHLMIEAQLKGYKLPVGFIEQWKRFQKIKASQWTANTLNFYGGDLVQAYRLYLLALVKAPEVGAMNRLKEFAYLSAPAKWRLAAAYKLIGQAEVASALIKGLNYTVKPYRQLGGTFGSNLRDEAMILETLTELGRRSEASKLLTAIAAELSQDSWYSTQTTAYALIAIAKYCGQNSSGQKLNFLYSINGQKQAVSSNSYLYRTAVSLKSGKAQISVSNQGKNRLFTRVIMQGQAPTGSNPPAYHDARVLVLNIGYKTQSGKLIDPSNLKQGTDFIAEVTVKNPGNRGYYEQMALTQIFPSGWEIINTRLADNDAAIKLSDFTYRDIRDDRVLTYFNIGQAETRTYQVLLNASYAGRYYLPATSCEAMYDNSIQAIKGGKWVLVK